MNNPETSTRSLVIERKLSHSAPKVWRALTQGALMEEWLMKNDFRPVVGHRFSFRAEPSPHWNGIVECQVLIVEPNQRLSYTWGSLGLESTVTFTLTSVEGGVLLRMEQSGFRPNQEQAYQGAKYGWKRFIDGLESVVAKLT
ncbi:MAG TPA: SRPBCC domain-containing protein [Steroidobacteraceae bacterium]